VLADDVLEIRFGQNRDALRIQRAGQRRGVLPVVDVRNLRGGEGDDVVAGIAAIDDVEIVEIAPGGAHDDGTDGFHRTS